MTMAALCISKVCARSKPNEPINKFGMAKITTTTHPVKNHVNNMPIATAVLCVFKTCFTGISLEISLRACMALNTGVSFKYVLK